MNTHAYQIAYGAARAVAKLLERDEVRLLAVLKDAPSSGLAEWDAEYVKGAVPRLRRLVEALADGPARISALGHMDRLETAVADL